MKTRYVIIAFVLSFVFVACSEKAPSSPNQEPQANTFADEPTVNSEEPEEEEVAMEAVKRDKMFYQNLLEYFCREHYKECFGSLHSPRNYANNSLIIEGEPYYIDPNMDGDRIVSWNVSVRGVNSWVGHYNYKHPDWSFEASIKELGDDKYQINFKTPEVWFGKPAKEILSATRVVEYSE